MVLISPIGGAPNGFVNRPRPTGSEHHGAPNKPLYTRIMAIPLSRVLRLCVLDTEPVRVSQFGGVVAPSVALVVCSPPRDERNFSSDARSAFRFSLTGCEEIRTERFGIRL